MEVSFSAFEFQSDETFHKVDYRYQGSSEKGWDIFRNDQLSESLGPGYVLLKSLYCGICSTDIARAKLPFPLPQITGHEVIALYKDKPVAVEINASHLARGLNDFDCHYCNEGMSHHCPERMTLGIDRLPGGFSPYILAPKNSICPLPEGFDMELSAVIEPLAAALHAVESSEINNDMQIVVVGPKRLGLLLILALDFFRKQRKLKFMITGVVRHSDLTDKCTLFGADEVVLSDDVENREFDLVFDTSGSKSGFELSVSIAKNTLHVKSTHGLVIGGFSHLTQMVIDELSLMPLNDSDVNYLTTSMLDKRKTTILCDLNVPQSILKWIEKNYPDKSIVQCDLNSVSVEEMKKILPKDDFKKFDIIFVSSMNQLNKILDFPAIGSLIRAKGDIHWFGKRYDDLHETQNEKNKSDSLLWSSFFKKNLNLQTSRCGDFTKTITLINENLDLFSKIIPTYISGSYELNEINKAFEVARSDKTSIKLVIKH